ncbi:MAG: tol-pal system protein YbgF [Pseudomonadota bacterium]|nr:tol-pal system protein YbgF [Pseudomonadota bacterium]
MILRRIIKPALVAGFFVWASASVAQVTNVEPVAEQAAVLPYVQADTSTDFTGSQPLPLPSTDSRSLALRVQQLEEEIRRLNGLVEEQASLLMRLQDQSLERYVEMDRRLAAIGTVDSSVVIEGDEETDSPAPDDTVPSVNVPVAVAEVQPGEREAYQSAYGLVRERQFEAAVDAFNTFLASYPFGRFAPNAHYWLGELYLVIEPVDPESARQNFQLLLDQYPHDRKVPDALYKLGRVHALKGNVDRSKEYLNKVIADYGAEQHPAAQLARDFLDSLD